jgi:hypothetical protein
MSIFRHPRDGGDPSIPQQEICRARMKFVQHTLTDDRGEFGDLLLRARTLGLDWVTAFAGMTTHGIVAT